MPVRSMTAYASAERNSADGTLACELRAVNHRFLEVGVRLPDELRALEPALRERVAARASRGKIDVVLRLRAPEGAGTLQLDDAVLDQLAIAARQVEARFPQMRVGFADLLQFPGVLAGRSQDTPALQADALAVLD